jgi:SAM-dependent methyltransferase
MNLNVLTLRHPVTLARLAWRKLRSRLQAGLSQPTPGDHSSPPAGPSEPLIDVQDLIRNHSIEDLNRSAEAYFSTLKSWDFHLSKPFCSTAEAPALLINFATMIQGLRLAPGLRVLDFGAGSGWTSRFLTQLGCEVILLDVSASALRIAEELYARQQVIGDRPEPRFLVFDGRKIDLSDGSVDRILCFDAFHHAPNPDEVIREFARILAPGGIAAFAEPGPRHSQTPQSQFEMRSFGVIENDIHLDRIWATASKAGFARVEVAAYNIPPFLVPLDGYDDLLAGGETYLRWAESARSFMSGVRNFFLVREGEEVLDSRRRGPELRASIEIDMPSRAQVGSRVPVSATVRNDGTAAWLASGVSPGGVSLGVHLCNPNGEVREFDFYWESLGRPPRRIEPGEEVRLEFTLPGLDAGEYSLEFDCVADQICWFDQVGSPVIRIALQVG